MVSQEQMLLIGILLSLLMSEVTMEEKMELLVSVLNELEDTLGCSVSLDLLNVNGSPIRGVTLQRFKENSYPSKGYSIKNVQLSFKEPLKKEEFVDEAKTSSDDSGVG